MHVPERFAIDFVQLDGEGRMYSGPIDQLSSFHYFGSPVRSAARGRVIQVRDGLPEQVPGELPPGQTIQTAGGNHVVVDIGGGRFAFYAHLQPGRIAVDEGDRVRAGELIGRLGNTGNTDAPHLHFHVMDSPSPLRSSGLPFTFDRFRGQGVTTDETPLFEGEPAVIDREALAGPHRNRLPIDGQLLGFG
jgi:murein DD-endopeptidase MepM/ murein hydrolase activator NlpD